MTISLAQFRIEFPEFISATDAFVQAYLDKANLRIDRSVWDSDPNRLFGDSGQGYMAAHMMALSPMGMGAKLVDSKGNTTYKTHYDELALSVSSGFRVAWPLSATALPPFQSGGWGPIF